MRFNQGDVVCDRFIIDKVIGSGGMSEVYSGRDLKLNGRLVAIKTSNLRLETRASLLQEVRSLSKLNHPNIGTLYDVCTHSGVDVIVMEFIEGRSLLDVLGKGPLSENEALGCAIQIADALSYAHSHGVVHRDIKPGNIVLTSKGGTKLLDFGIAMTKQAESVSQTPGGTEILEPGIAGTPLYMSPEQRSGQAVDHRSDIYSFGLVLAQMLTGDLKAASIPAILEQIPSRPIRLVAKKCMEADPADRWLSAGDLRTALSVIVETMEHPLKPETVKPRRIGPWVVVGLAAALAIAGLWTRYPATQPRDQYRFLVSPPAGTHFVSQESGGPSAVSPDGLTLALVAAKDGTEETAIWLLSLNSVEPTPLHGTEGASHPFWKPDGKSLAFFSKGKLKRIELPGGTPQDLCDANHGRGGTWSKDDVLIFSPDFTEALYSVPAHGGKREKITELRFENGETSHRWPSFLSDGRRFLFFVRSDQQETQGVYLGSLDDPGKYTLVDNISSSAVYARSPRNGQGRLIYVESGFVVARPFSESTGKVSGEPTRISKLSTPEEDTSIAPLSMSRDGTLVYGGGSVYSQSLQWVGRNGTEISAFQVIGQYRNPRLSPNRTQIAVERLEIRTGFASIWMFDLDRGVQNPFEQFSRAAFNPVWSPDGKNLLYAAFNGLWDLTLRDTANKTSVKVLRKGGVQVATDWSEKGWIFYQERGEGTPHQWDLGALEVATGMTKELLATKKNERQGRLSPNGIWLAFTSDDFNTDQVYIARFPDMEMRQPVSEGESTQPVWGADGQELFYISRGRDLMRVGVDLSQNPPHLSKPEKLFTVDLSPAAGFTSPVNYDVDSRGRRFLIVRPPHLVNVHQQITVRVNSLE